MDNFNINDFNNDKTETNLPITSETIGVDNTNQSHNEDNMGIPMSDDY